MLLQSELNLSQGLCKSKNTQKVLNGASPWRPLPQDPIPDFGQVSQLKDMAHPAATWSTTHHTVSPNADTGTQFLHKNSYKQTLDPHVLYYNT